MPNYDVCCVGHLTKDRIITEKGVQMMPGGTAYYFATALKKIDIGLKVATSFAMQDAPFFDFHGLQTDRFRIAYGKYSHYFENEYPANRDYRKQRVLSHGDAINEAILTGINASWYHFGPLLAGDIDESAIAAAAARGHVSLDVQGCIRKVLGTQVVYHHWEHADRILPLVTTLKANYEEARLLTGQKRIKDCIRYLERFDIKEIIITLGSHGAVIRTTGKSTYIPAFFVKSPMDTTGCGDTFMAGYCYSRLRGADIDEAGRFAAAMAAMKTLQYGPFTGDAQDVLLRFNHTQLIFN